MPSVNQPLAVSASLPVPTVEEVDRIAVIPHPIIRNLLITQCYGELSAAFAERAGPGANWCTFATWASKQAGQTIRQEDLKRTLEALLRNEPEVEGALSSVATSAIQMETQQTVEHIRQSVLLSIISGAAKRASDAVSRGNKKVFEEIAREFARFIATCFNDTTYTQAHIDEFCGQLRPGNPPEGQVYLCRAFTRYYALLFEPDPKKRAEAQHLANLEIGFHEQTRLQPEIAESLNTVVIDSRWVNTRLPAILFPGIGFWGRLRLFLKRFFGKAGLLNKAIALLAQKAQQSLRMVLTAHLMTLTLPPDRRLRLGHDVVGVFPAHLQQLSNLELLALLAQIDPTPDSLRQSGATDWANLPERMHYIADLFRCYHATSDLFHTAFTEEQLAALKAGNIPDGPL